VTILFLGAWATQLRLGSAISEMDQDGHPQVKVETEEIREFKWVNVIRGATFKPRLQNKHQLAV